MSHFLDKASYFFEVLALVNNYGIPLLNDGKTVITEKNFATILPQIALTRQKTHHTHQV